MKRKSTNINTFKTLVYLSDDACALKCVLLEQGLIAYITECFDKHTLPYVKDNEHDDLQMTLDAKYNTSPLLKLLPAPFKDSH